MGGRSDGHLVYDADCGFCTRSAHWLDRTPVPWHTLDLESVGATREQADHNAGFLTPDGRISALGAPAIAVALRTRGGWARVPGVVLTLPGLRALAAVAYRMIAGNRHRMPGGSAACSFESRP